MMIQLERARCWRRKAGNTLTSEADKKRLQRDERVTFGITMIVASIIIVLDQLSKWAITKWVTLYDVIPITSFLNITHQRNTGAAFSFLADAGGWQRWFFSVLAAAVSAYLVVWLWKLRDGSQLVLASGLSLVLGGAVGNLIDRLHLGYVVDFVQVLFGTWPFPSFNVADAAISVGAVLLIFDALFLSGKET